MERGEIEMFAVSRRTERWVYSPEIEWGSDKEPRRTVGREERSKIRVWEGAKENG